MNRALVVLVALAMALPGAAVAQTPQTNAPPGNSAIDEYLETVPGAAGNARPRPPGQSGGAGALTPAQRARLERLGPDGKSLANAVDATSPVPPRKAPKKATTLPKNAKPVARGEKAVPKSDGRSPVGDVAGTLTGSDGGNGMGFVLPAILLAALLAVIVLVLLRRRAAS
ncbi:MAG: hypothetical protein QOF69_3633 [Solirubrobacteraceae bacterium]|nr:hypothetical protein [Solirubrobacteraceae bacterium]